MKNILYKFYSPTCQPCRLLSIMLKSIKLPDDVELVEVDATERKDLVGTYGVTAVPTLVLVGKKLVGLKSKEEVEKFIYGNQT